MRTAKNSEHDKLVFSMYHVSPVCPSTSDDCLISSLFYPIGVVVTVFNFRSAGTFAMPLVLDCVRIMETVSHPCV